MTIAKNIPDGDNPLSQASNNELENNNEVEKGSGYGPPNDGSGETVPENELSPDGQPIKNADSPQKLDS